MNADTVTTMEVGPPCVGMMVIQPICDAEGQCLAQAGDMVTEELLTVLERSHITNVVLAPPAARPTGLALTRRLDHLFRHAGDSIWLQRLRHGVSDLMNEADT